MQISSRDHPIAPDEGFDKLYCELYSTQNKAVCEYILSKVQSIEVAEDLCQDVFTRLWSLKDKYAAVIEDYPAFLFKMAHNEAISYLRREQVKYKTFKNIPAPTDTELDLTEQVIYARQLEMLLQQAIQTLSPQRKKVYVLGKIEGIALDQIGSMLGIANRTVKEMMRLSNQQVRKYINEQMDMNRKRKYNGAKKATIKTALVKVKTLEAA